MFSEPDESYHGLVYVERFGPSAYVARMRSVYQRTTGAVLAPMNAFLLLQGIETVALRVERHVENARRGGGIPARRPARRVGQLRRLRRQPATTPWRRSTWAASPPSLLTFGVKGGYEASKAFYDRLKLIKRLVNIGDVKSLACHPASTTHRQMSDEARAKAGVTPEMIRLCVGIEHADDIIADLDQALGARRGSRSDPSGRQMSAATKSAFGRRRRAHSARRW